MSCQQDDGRIFGLVKAFDAGGGFEAVHARHHDVEQYDREVLAQHRLEGVLAGARTDHLLDVVVNDEDAASRQDAAASAGQPFPEPCCPRPCVVRGPGDGSGEACGHVEGEPGAHAHLALSDDPAAEQPGDLAADGQAGPGTSVGTPAAGARDGSWR